ncbi:putative ATP-dependent RNA helicase DHR1 [Sporothrix curviconia]|uniref:ATP-dependent RNA helicase DHR1 n=1 Tax=Sporothrix curviconia TaxID=1260050 RepID=A0ABP0BZ74_9PEZI
MPAPKKFVPRQRKHKARAREARKADEHVNANGGRLGGDAMAVDSNVTEILPEEQRARNEKKVQLRAELRAGQASQMSAKKAKRLEKYIETKLRKDESRELNERLATKSIDPAIFESSRDLGKGKKRRRAEMEKQRSTRKDEDEEEDSGSDVEEEEEKEEDEATVVKTQQKQAAQTKKASQPAPISKTTAAPAEAEAAAAPAPAPAPSTGSSLFGTSALTAGSGLKRPLDLDEDGRPILKKRQKRGGVKSKFEVEIVERAPVRIVIEKKKEELAEDDSDEWGGLSDDNGDGDEKEEEEDGSDDESDDSKEAEEETDSEEEDNDDDEDDSEEESEDESDASPRPSGFKSWAMAQRDEALGFKPTTGETTSMYSFPTVENFEPRPVEAEPLPISLRPTKRLDRKAFHVDVQRTPEVEVARLNLPVVGEEQQIIEAIHEHDVVILSGGTGSGKTTQVPQFLYEAGFGSAESDYPGMIGVTQPRRVAAVSMAKRVAEELGEAHGRAVAYQIRFESNVSKGTAIKFMTDGVLLRELSEDVTLRKYSAVVIDEAHERSINTDVLIGIVSRINTIRAEINALHASTQPKSLKPLKIIIMSATLQVKAFVANRELFKEKPRMIHVEGRQFPVTVHFAQHTRHDYVDEAFRKIVRGHRKLPLGGFLVFLTGEDEIQRLAKLLHLEINGVRAASKPKVRVSTTEMAYETEDIEFGGGLGDENGNDAKYLEGEEAGDDARRRKGKTGEEADGDDDYDEEEDEGEFVPDEGETAGSGPKLVHILPLFSKLSTKDQQRVFQPAPDGARQVILATNVAETSLTIPGVRYVFDCGRAKARTFNKQTGVQSFEVGWISKASASQRSGRAGRTGPGHCYRLYSSAVYEENFAEFSEPEILRMPIEGVVLQLKSMHVPHVSRFPFPTAPDAESLKRADRLLMYLAAVRPLDDARGGNGGDRSTVTKLGELMSAFPLSPRFAKILMVGHPGDCIHYVIALVAAMSADEVFVRPNNAIPAASATAKSSKAANGDGDGGNDADDADDDDKPRPIRTQADIKQDEARRRTAELFRKVHKQFTSLDDKSDALKLLQVIGEFSHEPTEDWCKGHFVHYKALREVQKMRRQITALLRANLPIHAAANLTYQEQLPRPTDAQVRLLKQMVAAGYPENIAQRADMTPNPPQYITSGGTVHKPRRAIEVPYRPLFPLIGQDKTGAAPGSEFVYIHPSSPMAHLTVAECPQYIVYSHLQRAAPSPDMDASVSLPKVRMRSLVDLTGLQLASLLQGTPLLSYGKPIKETFRSDDGRERECWVVPELSADVGVGGVGWPLPAIKVRQRKEPGQGWEVIARK